MDGRKLTQLRDAAGLSQLKLAALAGVTPRTVHELERGIQRDPKLSTIQALADALEVDVAVLLADADPPAPTRAVAR